MYVPPPLGRQSPHKGERGKKKIPYRLRNETIQPMVARVFKLRRIVKDRIARRSWKKTAGVGDGFLIAGKMDIKTIGNVPRTRTTSKC